MSPSWLGCNTILFSSERISPVSIGVWCVQIQSFSYVNLILWKNKTFVLCGYLFNWSRDDGRAAAAPASAHRTAAYLPW